MYQKINAGALALVSVVAPQLVNAAAEVSPPMVVTATRTAQTVDATLASVSLITREDIVRLQATTLQDVLKRLPGVSVSNKGGKGKDTSVYLRGTNSNHVLVLVDGVKVGSATLGTTAFQFLPIDSIERIEVVRGPRSALYGSEAIGGVIQIFTRQAENAFTPSFSISAGSHDSHLVSGGFSGKSGDTWYALNGSHEETGGFNATELGDSDSDGFRNESGSFRLGHRFADVVDVEVHGLYSEGNNDYDYNPAYGVGDNNNDFLQQEFGGKIAFSPIDGWNVKLTGGQSRDNSQNEHATSSHFDTKRDTFSWQNDIRMSEGQLLTFGYDYQDDKVDSTTSYDENSRSNNAVFGQYQGEFGKHEVLLALRKDDNEQFGHHGSGNIAWGYTFDNDLKTVVSFGEAIKAPTFNDLYWPASAGTFFGTTYISSANQDLGIERSKSFEFSVNREEFWGQWSVSLFENRIENLISWQTTLVAANTYLTKPENISKARIRGLEIVTSTQLSGWDLSNALTLMDPENRESGSANKGNVLARRAEQSFNLDADHDLGKGRVGFTLFAEGRRFDDAANTRRLGGYATLDLRAEYPIHRNWLLQGKVANLFNKEYRMASGYNTDGTTAMLTVRYQP